MDINVCITLTHGGQMYFTPAEARRVYEELKELYEPQLSQAELAEAVKKDLQSKGIFIPNIVTAPLDDPNTWTVTTRPFTEAEKKALDQYGYNPEKATLDKESPERCAKPEPGTISYCYKGREGCDCMNWGLKGQAGVHS